MNWYSIPKRGGGVESRAVRSDCGRYQIARVTVKGVDQYVLWQLHPKKEISSHSTPEKAKRAGELIGRKAA